MTSSTSLYPQPSGNANVASRNFTTLYSGSANITVQEPDQYGNANVVALLAASTDGANTIGVISATGNVIGNYFIGNGSQLTGIVSTYGNANVTTLLANFGSNAISTTGNVTAGYFAGNGSQLTGIVSSYGNANVSAYLASGTNTADMITTGNVIGGNLKTSGAAGNIVGVNYVSANFYLGDGGLLSNISSTYGNANVTALLSNLGANSISTTGNVTAANFFGNVTGNIIGNVVVTGANTDVLINNAGNIGTGPGFTFNTSGNLLTVPGPVSATGNITGAYIAGNGSLLSNITGANVTGVVANATYAVSAGSATTAGTVTGNAQANITSVGVLTSLSVTGNTTTGNLLTGGIVSATGNVTGNYILGNGSQLTGLPATYGNANVVSLLAAFGSNSISTTGNVDAGNVLIGNLLGAGNVTATGNVTGAYIAGNGSLLSNITGANVTGTVANATYAVSSGSATTAVTVTGNAQANITSVGTLTSLSVSGNTTTGNLLTGGVVSATGNITGNYFIGNGSALTDLAEGSNTQIQFNNSGNLAGNAAMTFENVTGNIGLGNLIVGSNNTGNANVGGSVQRINTIAPFTGITGNTTAFGNGQILIGNGYFGNLNLTLAQAASQRSGKVVLWDSANVAEVGSGSIRYSGLTTMQYVSLSSNIANTQSQISGGASALSIGGGTAGNAVTLASGPSQIFGHTAAVFVGQTSVVALGNTTTTGGSAYFGRMITNAGSTTTTGVGINGGVGGTGNTVNQIGVASILQAGNISIPPAKAYAYYMGPVSGSASAVNSSLVNNNASRIAAEYYFLRNDDAVAQTQLGTLRSYNEFNSVSATTSGALTIDKAVSQVHQVNLAGNITSVTYANMVSSLSDSVNTDEEVDTVTIIFNQGSTGGYSVTMPSGSTYKYAGGINTIATTANSVTLAAVTVVRISGTPTYLTTISPGFT